MSERGDERAADMPQWRPSASIEALRERARLLQAARGFFQGRGLLEVETPLLARSATVEPHLASVAASVNGFSHWLATSPEYAMKRLLAAGSGPIFQIARAFRDEPAGPLHNPEFTLIEWYQPGLHYLDLLNEVHALIEAMVGPMPLLKLDYRAAFKSALGLDPHRAAHARLRGAAQEAGLVLAPRTRSSRAELLDFLLGVVVLPGLPQDGLVALYDFPVCQATLARIRPGRTPVAERFEVIWQGVELANGYQELCSYSEFLARRMVDQSIRRQLGRTLPPVDERLAEALAAGLPEGSGVALGFDRLVMLATGAGRIDAVMAFGADRV
jgi:elongation factor P--(R)-beta-lysine ligase